MTRGSVILREVGADNWRDCAALEVTEAQQGFVSPVTRYLSLCAYGDSPWRPLAVEVEGRTIGFVMWGVDPADQGYWIGGLVVDRAEQRKGYGRAVVEELIGRARAEGHPSVVLSYAPGNAVARALYGSLGFVETGETEGDEIVARLRLG